MEDYQISYVTKNLPKLIHRTSCNCHCISILMAKGVFSKYDKEKLDSIGNKLDKAMEFYQILMQRKDAYKHLILALKKTKQTGALHIIQNINTVPNSCSPTLALVDKSQEPYFQRPINIIERVHLNQQSLPIEDTWRQVSQLLYPNPLSTVLIFKSFPWKFVQILYSKRQFNRAQNIGKEFLQTLQNNAIATNDADIIRIKYQIALVEFGNGNLENCCKTLLSLFPIYFHNRREEFSESEILSIEHRLALTLHKLGRRSKCLRILRCSFERQRESNGLNHWKTIEALAGLVNFLSRRIKDFHNSEAAGFELIDSSEIEFENLIPLLIEVYEGNKHKIIKSISWAGALITVASCLYKVGENEAACYIAYDVYDKIIKGWSGSSHELSQLLLEIAETLYFMKMYQQCLSVCCEARTILEKRQLGNFRDLQDIERLAEKVSMECGLIYVISINA